MKKILSTPILSISILLFISCATAKSVNKLDSPEDYYESESALETDVTKYNDKSPSRQVSENKISPNQQIDKVSDEKKGSSSSSGSRTSAENKVKPEENTSNTPNNPSTPSIKIEDKPISQDMQEELSDDSWARDENKVKLKRKDKDAIKNSASDDDSWGKE